jgi:hypothetical protein
MNSNMSKDGTSAWIFLDGRETLRNSSSAFPWGRATSSPPRVPQINGSQVRTHFCTQQPTAVFQFQDRESTSAWQKLRFVLNFFKSSHLSVSTNNGVSFPPFITCGGPKTNVMLRETRSSSPGPLRLASYTCVRLLGVLPTRLLPTSAVPSGTPSG